MANFVKYLNRFNENEKSTLCYVMNKFGPKELGEIHKGSFPFISIKVIVAALELARRGNDPYSRFAKKALSRIPEAIDPEAGKGNVTFMLHLDIAKVHRHFGANPERGKPLSFLPKQKVTVGKRWSSPKKDYVDDTDVLVSPCVTLRRITGYPRMNTYSVTVLAKCCYAVEIWLLENCS